MAGTDPCPDVRHELLCEPDKAVSAYTNLNFWVPLLAEAAKHYVGSPETDEEAEIYISQLVKQGRLSYKTFGPHGYGWDDQSPYRGLLSRVVGTG